MTVFRVAGPRISLKQIRSYVFNRADYSEIEFSSEVQDRVRASHNKLLERLEHKKPIYGITTGLGDSCHRYVDPHSSAELQLNLVRYLGCGTGAILSRETSRAVLLIHVIALSRGYSACSPQLIERMRLFLDRDWIPVIPREGSLGASGDLVPLSYVARALIGEADVFDASGARVSAASLMERAGVAPYKLQPKEGLSLVNGVSAMAAQMLVNLQDAAFLSDLALVASSWLCLALGGRSEAFSALVHEQAKHQAGQARAALRIRNLLAAENYVTESGSEMGVRDRITEGLVQDRYSLRCAPQIMGPVLDTIDLGWQWLENEINACSDNPLISGSGEMAMGGNFYGGYLSLGMDYLKISLANVADLMDRQLALIIDDKSNRGLGPNLAGWREIPTEKQHLHHGLKGLHQATSAITSEIMAKSIPNSIFSRSSESHNQDKVSLGMGAANQCADLIDQLYRVQTMHLVCLAQALDLREIKLHGDEARGLFAALRERVPFVGHDRVLGPELLNWESDLRRMARSQVSSKVSEV